MKRSIFVWIVSVLGVLYLGRDLVGRFLYLSSDALLYPKLLTGAYIVLIFLSLFFLYSFFMMKEGSRKLLSIVSILLIILYMFAGWNDQVTHYAKDAVLGDFEYPGVVIGFIAIIIQLAIWITLNNYIKKNFIKGSKG